MMNDPSAATMTGFVMSVVLLLGLAYLGFGERVGIKSPGPDARVQDSVQKQPARPTGRQTRIILSKYRDA